jgi:DNA-binding CsgD family transcriptional regulator
MRVIATVAGELVQLSPREREVLEHLAHGHANKAIAYAMGIQLSTVKGHVRNMTETLGLGNRVQLTLWAVTHPECLRGIAVERTMVSPFTVAGMLPGVSTLRRGDTEERRAETSMSSPADLRASASLRQNVRSRARPGLVPQPRALPATPA